MGCQSYLMRRRRWFIGMSSAGISSATRLPQLSSSAMRNDWIYGRKEENRCRVLVGIRERMNSCEKRCVWGRSPRLVFEDMKRRGGHLRTRKRQPQLIEGKTSLHQCRREYGARWLRIEDRRALLIKVMFLDLNRIKTGSLESAFFKIGSLAGTKVINRLWQFFSLLPIWVPLGQKGFTIKQTPLSLFHLQDLIFKNGKGRQDSREG